MIRSKERNSWTYTDIKICSFFEMNIPCSSSSCINHKKVSCTKH